MSTKIRKGAYSLEEVEILSAIWVLSCNDENPLISYEGIRDRLGLSSNYDIRALVHSRRELFRPKALQSWVREWKSKMIQGRSLPSWIKEETDIEKREKIIANLSADDVFRNQFRTKKGSPKASVEIMEWGLQYIDRLRIAHLQEREKTAKSWQIWLVFVVSLLGLLVNAILDLLQMTTP